MAALCSLFLGFVFRLQSPWLRYLPYLTCLTSVADCLWLAFPQYYVACKMAQVMSSSCEANDTITGHQSVADKHGTSFHVPLLWSQSFINLRTAGGLELCPSCPLSRGLWPLGWNEKPSQAHLQITSWSGGTATWKRLQLPFRPLCLTPFSLI